MDLCQPIHPQAIQYNLPTSASKRRDNIEDVASCEDFYQEDLLKSFEKIKATREGAALIEDGEYTTKEIEHLIRYLPQNVFENVFTFEELIRYWHDSFITSTIERWVEEEHPLLWKIQNSLWRYGYLSKDEGWEKFSEVLEGLKRISIDYNAYSCAEFEIRITHTKTSNTAAWSLHVENLYLDASFGLLVYYKGIHVLTVGFAPSAKGILVAQVQLRQKKGNRFLYKLHEHYMDFALEILYRAFGDCLWLVTGKSAVEAIKKSYGKEASNLKSETMERVATFYERPLVNFERDSQLDCQYDNRVFICLNRKNV